MYGAINKSLMLVRLPELKRTPIYEDLLEMAKVCERNRDRYVLQTWDIGRAKYSLRAHLVGHGPEYMRLKREGKLGVPEWSLLRGSEVDSQQAWVHSTGDLGLLLNMTLSEIEGQAMTAGTNSASNSFTNLQGTGNTTPSTTFGTLPTLGGSSMNQPVPPLGAQQQQQQQQQHEQMQHGAGPNAAGITLAGDIRELELQNVLQSIGLCKMSGSLILKTDLEQAQIYFHEGEVVDATMEKALSLDDSSDLRGDHAFLEVLTWDAGRFSFDKTRKSSNTTITRKVYALLMEGVMLRDYSDGLKKRGVDLDSRFVQSNPALTEAEFETALKQGLPLDVALQKNVYTCVRSGLSLYELLKQIAMPKAVWVPVIFNLLSLELIGLANESARPVETAVVEAFQIDDNLVTKFVHELVRPETGMCSHAAISYFVRQELTRFQKTGRPFAILMFEARCRRANSLEPLSNDALRECRRRFEAIMGPLDLLGQYQMVDFALLFPEAGVIAEPATLFDACSRFLSKPLLPGVESEGQLQLTISLYVPNAEGQIVLQERKAYK